MVVEVLGPVLVRVAANVAVRAYLARNPDVVEEAIRRVCQEESEIEIEQALKDWSKSAAFLDLLERLKRGERNFSDEIVRSFVDQGGFFLPDEQEQAEMAQRIVEAFLGHLVAQLLLSEQGLVSLSNRMEQLHPETVEQINRHTDLRTEELSAQLRAVQNALPALQSALTEYTQAESAPVDPEHAAIATQIDAARELIQRSKVRSARSLLRLLRESDSEIPEELEFRLSTNLGICELALDDKGAALRHFERAIELQPDNPLPLALASEVARLQGDLDRAETLAKEALVRGPEHPQAGAALIEALQAKGESEKIEETLRDRAWMMANETCRPTIARVWADQQRFDDAVELARQITEEDPTDIVARLTLAHCLLSAAQRGRRQDATTLCREVVEQSNKAWELLDGAELDQPLLQVLTARGAALAMLGSTSDALDNFEEILRRTPGDSIALLNKGLALCSVGRAAEGCSSFELISDPLLRAHAVLPHAAACLAAERPMDAVVILRGSFSLERRSWEDIRRAEVLTQAEQAAGAEDTVGAQLHQLGKEHPSDPFLRTLAGSYAASRNDVDDAVDCYLRALELFSSDYRTEVLWRLANCYTRQDRYRDAVELTTEVVNGDVAHEGAIPLLLQLRNSGDVKGALAWARRIREEHPEPARFALVTEADVLTYLGDAERAAACWRDICERVDSSNSDLTNYAQALLRTGSREGASEVLRRIQPEDLQDDPAALLQLAGLKMLLGEAGFLEDAYRAWRYGIGDPAIHLGYFSMFMSQDHVLGELTEVGPGCSVLVRDGSEEQWWHILGYGDEPRGERELNPTADGASSFLGREVGDAVTPRDEERRTWEIAAIQTKHVRAFQEIVAGFSTRFPNNREISSVPASPTDLGALLGVVDERDRFVRDLEQLYRDDRVPFGAICGQLQRPAPEIWRACTQNGALRVRFAGGSDEEAKRAAAWLYDSHMIVLDMLSLLTIHELGNGEELRRRFPNIKVPQSVVDEVRQMVFDVTVGAQPGGYVGRNVDGSYVWVELTDEQWHEHQEFARSLLDFAESFAATAAYPAAEAEYESVQQLRELLTDSGAGAIFAGDDGAAGRPLLVSDDFGLAEIAGALGIPTVNSQAVLLELRRSEILSDLEYSSKIAEMARLSYRFVRVNAADLQRLLEANGYITDARTRALAKSLEGPECTKDSAVAVISDLIADLATRGLPSTQETLLVSMFLGHLQRGRETTTALRECYATLEARLPNGAPTRERTLSLVASYIEVANG